MADKYRIDSHKLLFHPERVANWLSAQGSWEKLKNIYPLYMEISPVGYCNHRCTFCALDFMEYQHRQLDPTILATRLREMAQLGLKSVMFAGEGEPTLYKPLPEILDLCSEVGIDTSLTTNMVPFTLETSKNYVKNCKWIKVSINAGTAERYAQIHRTQEKDFFRTLDNMRMCVALKKELNSKCTLGAQMLLLDENADTAVALAEKMSEIGLDYLVIKPYSQHPQSNTQKYSQINYAQLIKLNEQLQKFNTEKFKVIFRAKTMEKWDHTEDRYNRCLTVPFFWGYIMSDADVYGCSCFLGNQDFIYGNINTNTFKEIWEGERRKKGISFMEKLDSRSCRVNCRMDETNRYLWELKNPSDHVNFICNCSHLS